MSVIGDSVLPSRIASRESPKASTRSAGLTPIRSKRGNPVRVEGLLGKFLGAQTRRRVLVAALDDASALAAKAAVEIAGRTSECVIVGLGFDRSVHGGASEKKEIDPDNTEGASFWDRSRSTSTDTVTRYCPSH